MYVKRQSGLLVVCMAVLVGSDSSLSGTGTPSTDTVTPQVVQIGAMSVERATHQATLLKNGQVLISGGCAGRGCDPILASAEIFDPETQSFRATGAMATPRSGHDATLLSDGRILVSGGWTGQEATNLAEVYDPDAGRWIAVGTMTAARVSHIGVSLSDGRVLIMGGGSGGLGDLNSVEIFDPTNDTFSAVGRMRSNHYLATRLADGRVLVTGGQTSEGEISGSAEIFDPVTNEFIPTGEMATPRVKHAAALLQDGRVLVIGGSDAGGYDSRYTSTEVYNPESGEFSPGPAMQWGRHKIRDAVVALPSGAIMVAGGAERPELFDPADQVFVPVDGQLSGPQMFATATLLPDNDVLVLGGYDHQTVASRSAWLVDTGEGPVSTEDEEIPGQTRLSAFPNPFREHVTVTVQLSRGIDSSRIAAAIYDASGKVVGILHPVRKGIGNRLTFEWDGSNASGRTLSSGTYFFVVETRGMHDEVSLVKVF